MKLNTQAFTLIELLVVILIIGILTAVALPQYQKAIEKSRASQIFPLLKAVSSAQNAYYLNHGYYAEKFSDLDVDIPWTGSWEGYHYYTDTKSNPDWSLQLSKEIAGAKSGRVLVTRAKGPYLGAGFTMNAENFRLFCAERPRFKAKENSYCEKIFQAIRSNSSGDTRVYTLP